MTESLWLRILFLLVLLFPNYFIPMDHCPVKYIQAEKPSREKVKFGKKRTPNKTITQTSTQSSVGQIKVFNNTTKQTDETIHATEIIADTLSSTNSTQETKTKNKPITCPCFNTKALQTITMENINTNRSCISSSSPEFNSSFLGIWKKRNPQVTQQYHNDFGFSATVRNNDDTSSSCMLQGDMMIVISAQEALFCIQLLQDYCMELGIEPYDQEALSTRTNLKPSSSTPPMDNDSMVIATDPVIEFPNTSSLCPCFNARDLERISKDNVDALISCPKSSSPNSDETCIWKKKIHDPFMYDHSAFGYCVSFGRSPNPLLSSQATCVCEGDIIMDISTEEASVCHEWIEERCVQLGLIETFDVPDASLLVVEDNSNIKNPSPSCPCFDESTLRSIEKENVDWDLSCQSFRTSDSIHLWTKSTNLPSYALHNALGYSIDMSRNNQTQSSCMREADMMMVISMEEAYVCTELMRNRCFELL